MDAKEIKEWYDEGFRALVRLRNGYAEAEGAENLYGGYIYDMVTQNNILYESIYFDGAFIQASGNSPFKDVIEAGYGWIPYAIIDPYCLKGKPICLQVHKGFMFKFKEIETKLWDIRQDIREKKLELIRHQSAKIAADGRAAGLRNEIKWLQEDIDKYMKMIGEE